MVDTPKDNGNGANTGNGSPRHNNKSGEELPKRHRQRRRSKGRRSRDTHMDTGEEHTLDNSENLGDPALDQQPDGLEEHEDEVEPEELNDSNDNNYLPFSEEEVSVGAEDSIDPEDPDTSEVRDGNRNPRHNKNKCRHNGPEADDSEVNAGFRNSKSGPRKKPSKGSQDGPTKLDAILDKPCQIHGTPDKPANHTNRNSLVIKQVKKLTTKDRGKSPHIKDDEDP